MKTSISQRLKLANRIKQTITAILGAAALSGLAGYQGYRARGTEVNAEKLLKFSLSIASILGVAWGITPSAKRDPKESIAGVKESIYPIVTSTVRNVAEAGAEPETEPLKPSYSSSFNRREEEDDEYVWDDKYNISDRDPRYQL